MSIALLIRMLEPLPRALADQTIGYARAVEAVAPEIFKDAGVPRNRELANQLVLIAGLRKLHAIVDSNYWIIEHTGALLEKASQSNAIRVGGANLSRGGEYHRALERIRRDLTKVIEETGLSPYIYQSNLAQVVRNLADGR